MPEVYLLSTSEVRIQIFTIDGKNLDCWNHPNMLSLKNRMGGSLKKKRFFVSKVYKVYKMRQLFFSKCPKQKKKIFLFRAFFLHDLLYFLSLSNILFEKSV